MVAKKVSPMDILYHRKSAEEDETNKGQNKESFYTKSLEHGCPDPQFGLWSGFFGPLIRRRS